MKARLRSHIIRQPSPRTLLMALAVLIVVVASGSALASGDSLEGEGTLLPSQSDVVTAIESGKSEANPPTATDPAAADGMALEGIDRGEALNLLNGVFSESVESAAGVFDELQGATLLGPNTAVLPEGGVADQAPTEEEPEGSHEGGELQMASGQSGRDEAAEAMPEAESRRLEGPPPDRPAEVADADLLDSTIPLQVGAVETIDLSLEHNEGHLEPAAPLVETTIPGELTEKIEFPELGIGIEALVAAPERAASISNGSVAFYPNVGEDSDLAISPTPSGVETMTQLRSADSPKVSTYHLSLPPDANLVAADGGGAEVRVGDEVLLAVPAPVGLDASGNPVPVNLEVSGHTLAVRVEPAADASLPILVDPVFQTYEWKTKNTDVGICSSSFGTTPPGDCAHQEEWGYRVIEHDWGGLPHLKVTSGANGAQHGLHIYAEGQQEAGNNATAFYTVPRYLKEPSTPPTSFIKSLKLSSIVWEAHGPSPSPYLFMGIWDAADNHWVKEYSHTGQVEHGINEPGWTPEFINSTPETNAKAAEVAIVDTESTAGSGANVWVGGATVELGDIEPPEIPVGKVATSWVNSAPAQLPFTAEDDGLGVYAISANTEELGADHNPLHAWKALNGCIGVGNSACPRTWSSTESGHEALTYDPSVLPSGIDYLLLVAEDPVGNKSKSGRDEVRVDHIAPTLVLTGTMTEQDLLGTRRASYTLKATASDGNAEHPQSGIAKAEVKLDGKTVAMEGKQAEEWSPKCTSQNCPLSAEWTLSTAGLAEGKHTVEVIATDAVGNSSTKSLAIETRPAAAPTLALSGSMTEQATLGTSRPRYILKARSSAMAAGFESATLGASPTYSSSIGASGTGEIANPVDVAADSSGNTWVVEMGRGGLQKFNEKGESVLAAGSNGSGAGMLTRPSGAATDSKNNVWVADTGNNRVVEFNEKGEFVETFGTGVNKTKVEAGGTEAEKNLCTAASGNVCQAATAGSAAGQLNQPKGIALTAGGNIWVADTGNSRIEKFNPSGGLINNISGPGSEAGKLKEPAALTVAPDGSIWVADSGNKRIEQWNSSLAFVRAIGKSGSGAGEFTYPSGIEADANGEIWVADCKGARVQEFDEWGTYLGTFGSAGGGSGQFATQFPAPPGAMALAVSAMGVTVDGKGSVWVTDAGNARLQHWVIPGFPVYNSSIGSSGTGNGQFKRLAGLASDGNKGHIWAVDQELGRLQEFGEKGEWLRNAGTSGPGAGMLSSPSGATSSNAGNVWVADTGNNRVVEFNEKGEFVETFGAAVNKTKVEAGGTEAEKNLCTAASGNVCQAATAGSAAGQLKAPQGVALTSGGNIWVSDTGNNRIEKFNTSGTLLNNLSGEGTEPGKLKEPAAIAVAPDGSIWVADTGNNRIQEWNSSLSLIRTIGKEGSGGGEFKSPAAIFADASGNIWVGDQKDNRVEEFGEGGRYRGQFGANGSGKFSLSAPMGLAVANGGTIWVADPGHSKIQKWAQETPRSEVTTTLWIDGNQQTGLHGTCKTSGCTIEPQWTLESAAVEAKSHVARVKTTDGLGRSTESSINFEIARDTTKPILEVSGELFNAPEGWVEQESYGLNATATDSGYGVTSIEFKIDGQQVASASQSCLEGGCKETLSKQISMAAYSGGSHSAELVATDGAGNTERKHWTINVDPEGRISTAEAIDTIEAAEVTGSLEVLQGAAEEGDVALKEGEGVLEAIGGFTPTEVDKNPQNGIRMEILNEGAFVEGSLIEEVPALVPIDIKPTNTSGASTGINLGPEAGTGVAADTSNEADTVIRPIYDGGLMFDMIRDNSAPETYSWVVNLEGGETIKQITPKDIEVYFAGGLAAYGISAKPAHDALGAVVPTEIDLSEGNVVTLTVKHRSAQFTYPVLAGTGWEGGYIHEEIAGPQDEQELREEAERLEREAQDALETRQREEIEADLAEVDEGGYWGIRIAYQGAPETRPESEAPVWAREVTGVPNEARAYRFNECRFQGGSELPFGPDGKRIVPNGASQQCHGNYEEHNGTYSLVWAMAVHGVFHYKLKNYVWLHEPPSCTPPWGPKKPLQLKCEGPPVDTASTTHIDVIDRARWGLGEFEPGRPYVCGEIDGVMSTNPPPSSDGERVLHETMHFYKEQRYENELPCDWDHLRGY